MVIPGRLVGDAVECGDVDLPLECEKKCTRRGELPYQMPLQF